MRAAGRSRSPRRRGDRRGRASAACRPGCCRRGRSRSTSAGCRGPRSGGRGPRARSRGWRRADPAPPRRPGGRRGRPRRATRRSRRLSPARDGTGRPSWSTSRYDVDRPQAPARRDSSSSAAMRRPLVGRRHARPRVVAHHREADRAVADERGEVDAGAHGVDRVPVAVEVGPGPRHVVVEQVAGDVLDVGEQVGDRCAGGVGGRVQREAAVADEHRGDAVQRLGVERGIPEHLRVGVGVGVDEAGGDDRARRRRARPRRRGAGRCRPRRCARRGRGRRLRNGARPVPSTTSPPRMSRSRFAMAFPPVLDGEQTIVPGS